MTPKQVRPAQILVAEDNPADVELIKQAMKHSHLVNQISVVGNGVELLSYLRKTGEFKDVLNPDIVLLDLNMPKMSGIEVLAEIRSDKALTHLPVVMLSTSDREQDVSDCYQLHVNCYVKKPLRMSEFEHMIRQLEQFWFFTVTLPPAIR